MLSWSFANDGWEEKHQWMQCTHRTGYRTLTGRVNLFYDGGKTLWAREVEVVPAEPREARSQPVDKMTRPDRHHVSCLPPPEKEQQPHCLNKNGRRRPCRFQLGWVCISLVSCPPRCPNSKLLDKFKMNTLMTFQSQFPNSQSKAIYKKLTMPGWVVSAATSKN